VAEITGYSRYSAHPRRWQLLRALFMRRPAMELDSRQVAILIPAALGRARAEVLGGGGGEVTPGGAGGAGRWGKVISTGSPLTYTTAGGTSQRVTQDGLEVWYPAELSGELLYLVNMCPNCRGTGMPSYQLCAVHAACARG
jgi:hypothetical protein